jgi:hypothetical protein
MGLSINTAAVEAKVRRLAALTGLGVTEAIDLAVSDKLAREGRFGPLPPRDQEAIEKDMYDAQGLER